MTDPRLAWFVIGASCSAMVFGWPWRPRFSRRIGSNPPPQPLAADLIRYARWEREQIERAVRDEPIRFDPGRVQRGNGSGGPTAPKPNIIPRGTRSISFPDPAPDRQPTNPYTGGRVVDIHGRTGGYTPISQGGTPNPPPTEP